MSLNLHDPLLQITDIRPRQTGGPLLASFLLTAQEGGVGPILPRVPHGGLSRLFYVERDEQKPKETLPM